MLDAVDLPQVRVSSVFNPWLNFIAAPPCVRLKRQRHSRFIRIDAQLHDGVMPLHPQ